MATRRRKPLRHHLFDYFFPHARNGYHPHLFRLASVTAIVALVLVLEGAYLAQVKLVFPYTNFLASILPGVLVDLTNEARAARGVPTVTHNSQLDRAAQAAAEDMAERGYFAHVSPDGKAPWYWLNQVGYQYSYAGENLAVNFTDSEEVQSAWLASPTHYANIIKPQYTEVGFGTASGRYEGKETTFVVEFFATPAASAAAAPVAVASLPPAPTPAGERGAHILGSESAGAPIAPAAAARPGALAAPAAPHSSSWFARVAASPTSSVAILLAIASLLIAMLFATALMLKGSRVKHANLVTSGALLLILFSGSILFDSLYLKDIKLPSDAYPAAVGSLLLP